MMARFDRVLRLMCSLRATTSRLNYAASLCYAQGLRRHLLERRAQPRLAEPIAAMLARVYQPME
jgi:hypothetical protein